MKYTHYYAELGLKPTDWPFEEHEDIIGRNIADEEGFVSQEFFSLDYSLALYIYGRLRYFQDNCLVGYPMNMTEEEWQDILNKMIKAFKLYCIKDEPQDLTMSDAERLNISKNRRKQINYGMRLFIKYFHNLWY